MNNRTKYSFAFLVPVLLFFAFGELLLRTYDYFVNPNLHQSTLVEDDKLGWRSKANHADEYKNGSGVQVHYRTFKNGFKRYDSLTNKRRILIIGDSFTQAVEVSNQDNYYAQMAATLDFDFFVYGMSGYGTMQEKMILDENLADIQPDLVILQFCSNDFIDNCLELNRECNYQINSHRPYQTLTNETIYANPLSVKDHIFSQLHFTNFINSKLKNIAQKINVAESGEGKIARLNQEYLPFKNSIAITKNVLQAIKNRLPNKSKLLVFCSDGYEPQLSTIRTLCSELEIEYVEEPIHQIRESVSKNINPYAQDGVHWNEVGHRIVGGALEEKVVEMLQ